MGKIPGYVKHVASIILVAVILLVSWKAVVPQYFENYPACSRGCHQNEAIYYKKISYPLWCVGCHGFGVTSEILSSVPFHVNKTLEEQVELHGECLLCHRVPGAFHEVHLEEGLRCTECHQNAYHGHHTDKPKSNTCIKCHDPRETHPELDPLVSSSCRTCHGEEPAVDTKALMASNLAASATGTGLSSLYPNISRSGCIICHTVQLGYPAHKVHSSVSCESCHRPDLRHGETGSHIGICVTCHRDAPMHEEIPALKVPCTACHEGWNTTHTSLLPALRGCEGCHGKGFPEQLASTGLHKIHTAYFQCSSCHGKPRSHSEFFSAPSSPETCYKCHDNATGRLVIIVPGLEPPSPPPRHGEMIQAANGNCFACHYEWNLVRKARLVIGGEEP